jgi:hypothetical protein
MSIFSICRFTIQVASEEKPGSRPEEGEEHAGLDAFHAGAVGHDQGGVDAPE